MSGDDKQVWQGDGNQQKVAYNGGPNPGAQEKAGPLDPQGEGTGRHGYAEPTVFWGGTDKGEHSLEVNKNHDPVLKTGTGGNNNRRPDRSQGVTDSKVAPTNFFEYSVNGLKKLVLNAKPWQIEDARLHWLQVYEWLSGGEGGAENGVQDVHKEDSIAAMLQKAVDNVCEHWEGLAANAFRLKAAEVTASIGNASQYAKLTADQLKLAHSDLVEVQQKISEIEPPSKAGSAADLVSDGFTQNDDQAMEDLRNGVRADVVATANEGSLSAGMEKKLQAAALMEQLAANYMTYSRNLRRNSTGMVDDKEGISKPDGNVEPGVPITVPGSATGGLGSARATNKPWSAGPTTNIKPAPTGARAPGITGGSQLPSSKTKVDSITPGLTGTGPGAGSVGVSGGGGGVGTGGAQGPGIVAAGGASGLGRGASARGGIGAAGGRGGLAGGGAGGRAGIGGMGGGAGAGAAGRGGAGAGGRGALAKSRGGVVGAAKGVTGKGAGGGAGLHGSRGGTQRGAMAGGMAGGMGGRNGRRSEEDSQGDRPDYLVEDEETWISEEDRNRNVPRTIE